MREAIPPGHSAVCSAPQPAFGLAGAVKPMMPDTQGSSTGHQSPFWHGFSLPSGQRWGGKMGPQIVGVGGSSVEKGKYVRGGRLGRGGEV